MRLLLIAYEFPPSPSPQSLRWTYLVRELDALGHDVHVLAPDLGGETPGLPALPDSIRIHRTYPGFMRGLLSIMRKRSLSKAQNAPATNQASTGALAGSITAASLRPPRNWKQRISERVQTVAAHLYFPDIRGEWRIWGLRELRRLLRTVRPDVVISSHEPATTLELGLEAKRGGALWVADLGDPVLAAYTPARWRRRAWRLERQTCEQAALVVVTNPAAEQLLHDRHTGNAAYAVLPQGFDDRLAPQEAPVGLFEPSRLELLYTGSFYSFRRPDALIDALGTHPAIRLNIAAITVPESILAAARVTPQSIRLLGFMPHTQILALQRHADVLVNIANIETTQIPGKVNEYMGAGRPLLHLGNGGDDPVASLVLRLHRGWSCINDYGPIAECLSALANAKALGRLDSGLSLDQDSVAEFGWSRIAARLDSRLRAL
jgi:glycosyltransferase involved in cell wall biosynthesis